MIQLRRTIFVQRAAAGEAADLRNAVSAALTADPFDERVLQHAVWNFVASRSGDASPGRILAQLGAICEDAEITPLRARYARRRQVMLWCIEECFGHVEADDALDQGSRTRVHELGGSHA